MDNDDNDYQGQGLHLVGEESSKVSPVLRPFTLPKFDFDVGHIRFDSLVENEVFLGIPSQEDNQWIEDFSRGSSGLEFSSGAADSCSIPRHNNVWSEATSSETVEMLLKSVGQEELVPGESIIQDSDAGDELPSLTNQMEDKIENVNGTNSVLPSVEVLEKISEPNQNPDVEDGHHKCNSDVQEVDLSVYGSSVASTEKSSKLVTEAKLHFDMKSFDDNQRESCISVNESSRDHIQDDTTILEDVQNAECLLQDTSPSVGTTNDQNVLSDVHHGSDSGLTDYRIGDHIAQDDFPIVDNKEFSNVSAETCAEDLNPPVQVEPKVVERMENCAAEVTTSNLQEPSSFPPVGNSDLLTEEGLDEEGNSADKKEYYPGITDQKGSGSSVILVEAPMLSGAQIESSEQGGHAIKQGEDDLSLLNQSSIRGDCGGIPNSKDGNDASGIHNEDTNAANLVSTHREAGSGEICEEFSSSKLVHEHECGQDVLIHEKVPEEMISDSVIVDPDSVGPINDGKIAESSAVGEVPEENVETTHGSEFDASSRNKRGLNFEVEGTSNLSPKTVENSPPVDSAEVFSHNAEQKPCQFEQDREMQMEMPTDAKTSSLQVSGDEAFQQCPDSEAKTGVPDDTAAEVVLKDANQSAKVVVVETCDTGIDVEQVAEDGAPVELFEERELCSVHSEPNVKVKEGAEAVEINKHEEPPREKNHVAAASSEVLGGGISTEIEKPNTTSDGVNCSPGLSQSDTDKQASVEGGKVENLPLSNSKEVVGVKALLNPMPLGVNIASEGEKGFTFDVSPLEGLPEVGTSKDEQSTPRIQAQKGSTVVDGSPSMAGSSHTDPKAVQEISQGSKLTPGKGALSGASKGASERKARRGSSKSGKENARKGISVKETVPLRQSQIGDRLSVSMSPSGSVQLMQLEVGSVERSGAKTGMVLSVSGSSLPDLNTSAPISLLFQQPFTDLQQVQLRAQIFVYGSLIQGVAPDEACMVSAFGISDGGRSFWEPAWRACLERLHGQKSHPSSSETPVQSRSGSKASDQPNKQGPNQSKVFSTPGGRVSGKSTPSPVVNPMIPLSSPLWNMPTPSCDALTTNNQLSGAVVDYQAFSPLHAYQTPTVRNFAGNTNSWPSQTPFPGSWVSSAQNSAIDARFSSQPVAETVKLNPMKESSVPVSSAAKHASLNPIAHGGASSVFSGTSSLHDVKKASANTGHSTEKRSRKRKKASVGEDVGQNEVPLTQAGTVSAPLTTSCASGKSNMAEDLNQGVLVSRSHTDVASHPVITSHFSTSLVVATPSTFALKSGSDKSLTVMFPVSSIDHTKGGDAPFEKRLLKPEDIAKVEEAKLQAEEAAGHAAIAVTHCQNVWCQLDKHKNSGLMSDVEAKVASAAVAIAAAASIAKAAAAAAKIASNVALQAKLMADETLISNGTQNPTQADLQSQPGIVNNMGNATPASILKAGDGNSGSSSIIFAAREAARRKIEAASAASRHAENLEAIVKAAELAAEAVSQAGKVVSMGDPLAITKLVEAGPEGYWKSPKLPSSQGAKSNNTLGNISNINSVPEVTDVILEQLERPSDKELHSRSQVALPFPKEISRKLVEDQKKGEEGMSSPVTRSEKGLRGQKNRRPSDLSKTKGVIPELEIASRSTTYESMDGTLNDSGIKESCLVEVFKDNGDFTGAWFSANVLSLKGGKASVCYTDLESAEGSGKLKEWVPLGAEGSKPPRIRLAHPMTSITFEGTRKRRRADARDYTWSLGDRVDAWIENGWREGVILEKNKKDETTLSIHFPAQGKTSIVRAWHLRPTLVWKDGEWIEWSNFKESLKGDTPQEKRLKMGSPPVEGKGVEGKGIEAKGKEKMSKNMDFSETGKMEESRLLPLSANEKTFNIGSTRNENKPETLRTMRSGLQKEGSKVIFGVPKPGKKRKFMEVSKHYVSDHKSKNNVHNDSEKFAKHLMPQGPGSRPWRNNSKIDSKDKQAAEANKPKGLKSGKPPNLSTRSLPQKDKSVMSSAPALTDATLTDNVAKDPTSNDDNESGQQNLTELVSSSNNEEAAEEHISQEPQYDAPRKGAKTNSKSERLKKGRLAPTGGKLAKVEVMDKTIPEAVEPRRSNRKIQPTSRLLEGLQSSLIISKFPTVSHDKNQKGQNNRGLSRGTTS